MNTKLYDETSVVERVDALIKEAITLRASDIHLEPTQHDLRVRFRIDGVLTDRAAIDLSMMGQLISRLKVLAHINIAEKRVPQDGKFHVVVNGHHIDLRVSTFPSLYGEKIVIRILDRSAQAIALEQLGFSPEMLNQFKLLIHKPHGLLLVTGPTGSGKTTTLYAALAILNTHEKNIVTLEDPVEYNLDGITQGHINPAAGFTFEKGIRSLLRQDPDILMVGEIRDKQTARIAIEAALTGHLVLSTLHTNDSASALMRLMDMGIEPFLINASLHGILAQRLVRMLCNECKEIVEPTEAQLQIIKNLGGEVLASLAQPRGCSACDNLGYKGRIGVFELLNISGDLRSLIVQHPNFKEICEQTYRDGLITLLHDALDKLKRHEISLDELMRILN